VKEDIRVVVFDVYGVMVDRRGDLHDGILDIIKELRKKRIKIILCSNSSRKMLEIWDSKYDFLKYFDEVVLAETVKAGKPEPEIFHEIIDLNPGISSHNILFIDDKDENILGSEAEGLIGLKFKDISKLKVSLKKLEVL